MCSIPGAITPPEGTDAQPKHRATDKPFIARAFGTLASFKRGAFPSCLCFDCTQTAFSAGKNVNVSDTHNGIIKENESFEKGGGNE